MKIIIIIISLFFAMCSTYTPNKLANNFYNKYNDYHCNKKIHTKSKTEYLFIYCGIDKNSVIEYILDNNLTKKNSKQIEFFRRKAAKVKIITKFKHGLRSGKETIYFENGNLKKISNYKNNFKNGKEKGFYKSGQLRYNAYYINSKKEIFKTEFYKSGTKKRITFYKNDLREGKSKTFYSDGKKIRNISYYKNNYKNGSSKTYFKNGKIKYIHYYKKGRRTK